MPTEQLALLAIGIFIVALLYSSVGHAGASGYIAIMTLFGLAQAVIKPTALTLNILVSIIGTWQFWRAGHFSWRLFWPFAVTSIPFAFIGGYINLPTQIFKILVGIVLLFSAARLLLRPSPDQESQEPPRSLSLFCGGVLGLLSGLTGTGGGIFLTPLLLFKRWAKTKTAAATSAMFILVNSISGLTGYLSSKEKQFPEFDFILMLAIAAGIGGAIGSYFGSKRFEPSMIKRCLAVVLVIAGLKLVFTKEESKAKRAEGPGPANVEKLR